MSKPNRWHPCFLPDNYRERLKQYQAVCERGDEGQAINGQSEIDRQSAQLWGLTDAEMAEIQRSLKELTE